ncbi:TetR/AcrR family transcriptional regulator [Nonomuraea sp. NPDC059023]|uniref:TetR/AcrR family transcriptional regulator n=1 Tax=unclassified Nonomuraea TaxID=2593643 RepID=UPI00369429AA
MEASPPQRRVGGRGARVTQAVHLATVAALTERGLAALTIEDIAARAAVHKSTIYRRWGTREALLADALASLTGGRITVPDTGQLRGDLVALARQVRDVIVHPASRTLMAALAAGRHHDAMAEVGHHYWRHRYAAVRPILERAVSRGELPATVDADTLITRIVGPIWFSVFGPGFEVDDTFVDGCVDVALNGT